MGNAATVLSGEEKAAITRAMKEKYAEISDSKEEDMVLYNALKATYETVATDVIAHRSTNGEAPETKEDGDEFDVEFATFSLGKNFGSREASSNKESETISTMESQGPAKLLRARTSSELLLMVTESVNDDQAKIANFISQLKSGELAPKAASDFRTRRLTFSQNTQEEVGAAPAAPASTSAKTSPVTKPSMKRMQSTRTSIFASSEIGYVHEKKAPFPNEFMGTYSCHGIEPSADEEDGIHEKINQDRGCVVYPYNSKRDECLLMCLDGHGEQGDKVSEFVMRQIVVSLEKDPQLNIDPVAALKNAYITTNTALMVTDIRYMTSGCTCVTIYAKGGRLYVANVGDSRAVMACENEEGVFTAKDLTRDHKPDDPEEQARIEAWGGFVCPPQDVGLSARVYLDPQFTMIGLAMARSIGDHAVKAVGVIPEPEVTIFDVEPVDRFIIIASDGVWEFISSQEAVEIVQSMMHLGCHTACQELIETAAARWQEEEGDYRDDITAVIVRVPLPFTEGGSVAGSTKSIAPI